MPYSQVISAAREKHSSLLIRGVIDKKVSFILLGSGCDSKSFITNFSFLIRAAFTTLHFPLSLEWAQRARVFHYTKMERSKYSSLLGLFVSYEENEVL